MAILPSNVLLSPVDKVQEKNRKRVQEKRIPKIFLNNHEDNYNEDARNKPEYVMDKKKHGKANQE